MTIPKEVLEALMKDYKNPEDLIGETGLLPPFPVPGPISWHFSGIAFQHFH